MSARPPQRLSSLSALDEGVNARFLALIESLEEADWDRPTDCSAWDVHDLVAHVVGAAESFRLRENAHQVLAGLRRAKGRPMVDGVNDLQVAERSEASPDELVERFRVAAPRFARFRRRFPAPLRWTPLPVPVEGWSSMGRLFRTIYTRDVFLHRIDLLRAVERPVVLDAAEAPLVEDVVADWAARHGKAFELVLTGPAGGSFASGEGGEQIEIDAAEFCRHVSGRAVGTGLLSTEVLF